MLTWILPAGASAEVPVGEGAPHGASVQSFENGALSESIMPYLLHPNVDGYQIWMVV
jgi:hypothetical protein